MYASSSCIHAGILYVDMLVINHQTTVSNILRSKNSYISIPYLTSQENKHLLPHKVKSQYSFTHHRRTEDFRWGLTYASLRTVVPCM